MIENKKVMAKNILRYMNERNVTATDICKTLGFKQNTFSDWVNAKTYPRIDKIELMARYFQISKADLVEEPEDTPQAQEIRKSYLTNTFKLSEDEKQLIEAFRMLGKQKQETFLTSIIANAKKGQDSELSMVANDK